MPHVPRALSSKSDSSGTILMGKVKSSYHNSSLAEDDRVFNTSIHETEIHVPIPLFDISDDEGVHGELSNCLDMPIRLKGEDGYYIPDNWKSLIPVIHKVIDTEHTNNPAWRDYYTYLSVHYTRDISVGQQQRHAGCHTDGFQGVREPVRTKGSRSYVAVTNGGTRFFPQKFVASLDSSRYNVFDGFDIQVEKNDDGTPIFSIAEEDRFYFFDAYTVHESGKASRNGSRLFVRLTWEMKLFDRAGNTKNSMLNYNWKPVEYDIRSDLITPTLEDIERARLLN